MTDLKTYFFTFIKKWILPVYLYIYKQITYSYECYIISKYSTTPKFTEEEEFILSIKTRFLNWILRENTSSNILPIFYKKEELTEYMKTSNTEIEQIWKSRIQLTCTPRGNIVMFYDPYKMGFCYYSDQNILSYDILNAVAMKYVMIYWCANFFIDEVILPDTKNPLKIHFISEDLPISKRIQLHTLKKMKIPPSQIKNTLRNKFIYLGNLRNFSICQTIRSHPTGFHSTALEEISGHNRMSWIDFKKGLPSSH